MKKIFLNLILISGCLSSFGQVLSGPSNQTQNDIPVFSADKKKLGDSGVPYNAIPPANITSGNLPATVTNTGPILLSYVLTNGVYGGQSPGMMVWTNNQWWMYPMPIPNNSSIPFTNYMSAGNGSTPTAVSLNSSIRIDSVTGTDSRFVLQFSVTNTVNLNGAHSIVRVNYSTTLPRVGIPTLSPDSASVLGYSQNYGGFGWDNNSNSTTGCTLDLNGATPALNGNSTNLTFSVTVGM